MADLPPPPNGRVVGECIYCGSTNGLTREHAVPYGLNGVWTLHDASCTACAGITHRFERDTLKSLFPAVRTVLAMQTRRPKKRPSTLPLVLERAGTQQIVQVAPTEFPLYLPIIDFPPPGFVDGRPEDQDIPAPVLDFRHLAGPSFADVARRYPGIDFVGTRLNFAPEHFARTLAKIGYCVAVLALGVEPLRNAPIRHAIRGEDRRIWHWVGSWKGDEQNPPRGLHGIRVRAAGADVHVIIRLFAQFNGPEYHVAIGPASPEFVNSAAWPWK